MNLLGLQQMTRVLLHTGKRKKRKRRLNIGLKYGLPLNNMQIYKMNKY